MSLMILFKACPLHGKVQHGLLTRTTYHSPICKSPFAYGGPSCSTNNPPLAYSHYFTSTISPPLSATIKTKTKTRLPSIQLLARPLPKRRLPLVGRGPQLEGRGGETQRPRVRVLVRAGRGEEARGGVQGAPREVHERGPGAPRERHGSEPARRRWAEVGGSKTRVGFFLTISSARFV